MRGKRWIAEVQAGKWVVYVPPKQARCCPLLTTKASPPSNITIVILPICGVKHCRALQLSLASLVNLV
jgi:hypothetical protein